MINCVKNRQASERAAVQRSKYLYCGISLNSVLNGTPTFMFALLTSRRHLFLSIALYSGGL